MTQLRDRFLNVIVCDDVREETGNKKSLMGVIGGDVVVPAFPASILISLYAEFVSPDPEKDVSIILALHIDDADVAKVEMQLPPTKTNSLLVLPKGLVTFAKESIFRVTASVGSESCEIVSKKVLVGAVT